MRTIKQHLRYMAILHKGMQGPIMLRCRPTMSDEPNEWNLLLGEVDDCIGLLRKAYASYVAYEREQAQLQAENPGVDFWEVLIPLCEVAYRPTDQLITECITLWNMLNQKYFALLQGAYLKQAAKA